MNAEGSREKELMWHCWPVRRDLKHNEAREYFEKYIKPSGYTYEKFAYDPRTGIVRTA